MGNKAILWLELLCTVLALFLEQKELLMGTQGRAVCSLCLFTWTQEGQWDRQQMASHTLFQAALCFGKSKTVSEQAEYGTCPCFSAERTELLKTRRSCHQNCSFILIWQRRNTAPITRSMSVEHFPFAEIISNNCSWCKEGHIKKQQVALLLHQNCPAWASCFARKQAMKISSLYQL